MNQRQLDSNLKNYESQRLYSLFSCITERSYLFTSQDQAQRTQTALLESGIWVNEEITEYLPGELEEINNLGERINWVSKATQRRK